MHNLRIEGRKIFLDGFEVKGVGGYTLKAEGGIAGSELTLKLTVGDAEVNPSPTNFGSGKLVASGNLAYSMQNVQPEGTDPMAELEKTIERTFGSGDNPVDKAGTAEFGRVVVKAINEAQRRAGKTLLDT